MKFQVRIAVIYHGFNKKTMTYLSLTENKKREGKTQLLSKTDNKNYFWTV
ncbi:hypothetical protein K710_0180 [Streptococcus iniae SF1]|nr:hypothetical protein K710_0180 [Streptococcus iniae SF1]